MKINFLCLFLENDFKDMKLFLILLLLCTHSHLYSFELRELNLDGNKLFYYITKPKIDENHKTLVFLHGSVSLYKDLKNPKLVPLDSLLEMNTSFINEFANSNYMCIVPIAFGEYNWLEGKGEIFLDEILKKEKILAKDVNLSGFSDGATGSFRYFYKQPSKYKSLTVFNAYPQLDWFSKEINYEKINNKKVLYLSQKNDKAIPYEFLLLEYRRQKMFNQETYFVLREGKHEFIKYSSDDFKLVVKLLETPIQSRAETKEFTWIYPAIDGLIVNNVLLEVYPFRESIGKKYEIDIKEYKSQSESFKLFRNYIVASNNVRFLPLLVSNEELLSKDFFNLEFIPTIQLADSHSTTILMDNYKRLKAW